MLLIPTYLVSNSNVVDRGTYSGKSLTLDGSADYLSRSASAGDSTQIGAIFGSFKRHSTGGTDYLWSIGSSSPYTTLNISSDTMSLYVDSAAISLRTDMKFRDPHHWYQYVILIDTTQATASDRVKLYIDGVRITDFSTETYPSLNYNSTSFGTADTSYIGRYYAGLYADVSYASQGVVDGLVTTIDDYGHFSETSGKWVIDVTVSSWGSEGYYLDFNDDRASTPDTTTTIYDQSGNSNNWTGNSLTTDSFTSDTPVDTSDTFNYLSGSDASTYSNGNRTVATTSGNDDVVVTSIPIPTTGKWGMKVTCDVNGGADTALVGVIANDAAFHAGSGVVSAAHNQFVYAENGNTYQNSTSATSSGYTTWGATNEIEVFFDADAGTVNFSVDGAAKEGAISVTAGKEYLFCIGSASGSAGSTFTIDTESALSDTDYKVLKSTNLPEHDNWKPQDNANIVLYTGDGVAIGSGGNSITGAGFAPDMAWLKDRDNVVNHRMFDSVRGGHKRLLVDTTAAETTTTEELATFDSDGFTLGSNVNVNGVGIDFWSLVAKAGGAASSNTDGSITSNVSTDGLNFSIVTYTGTGANATVGHGLAEAPDVILVKERDATGGWFIYHVNNTDAPETDYLQFTTAATADNNTIWNDTAPTSSVFSLGTGGSVNGSSDLYVAYCIKFGDVFTGGGYTGNGSTDGTFIPTDELLMFCQKGTNIARDWGISVHPSLGMNDVAGNPVGRYIFPNSSNAEANRGPASGTDWDCDYLSNGIKTRTIDGGMNSANTYIWWGIKKNGGQLSA